MKSDGVPRKTCRRARCVPQDCCGAVVTVRWWLHGDPLPEGWHHADHAASHHSFYSRLIERDR